MQLWKSTLILSALALGTGCVGGDDTASTGSDGSATATGTSGATPATNTNPTADGTADGSGDNGTADDTAGTADESSTGPDPTIFMFDETPPEEYTQVDRAGMAAINTGLNILGDKDAANASNPAEDISGGQARDNYEESLVTLHEGPPGMKTPGNTGLDDDLTNAGLTPCNVGLGTDCLDQAGPFTLPDTLNLVAGSTAGFPDGRGLEFPVIDVVLALLLLDTEVIDGPHPLTQFTDLDGAGLSLNPIANDVEFPGAWPYLAPPHE